LTESSKACVDWLAVAVVNMIQPLVLWVQGSDYCPIASVFCIKDLAVFITSALF
jgi:hypothetical protein